jgi:hypothetical protein
METRRYIPKEEPVEMVAVRRSNWLEVAKWVGAELQNGNVLFQGRTASGERGFQAIQLGAVIVRNTVTGIFTIMSLDELRSRYEHEGLSPVDSWTNEDVQHNAAAISVNEPEHSSSWVPSGLCFQLHTTVVAGTPVGKYFCTHCNYALVTTLDVHAQDVHQTDNYIILPPIEDKDLK